MRFIAICLVGATSLMPMALDAAPAQAPTSAALAKQLTDAMSTAGADALAVRDPEAPGRAIAVLAFPQSQLLVIAGAYPDQTTLDALLANRMYRDVYSGLQQPTANQGKVFFQDMGCDGLDPAGRSSVDIMYENATSQTIFDGDWKKQKISQSAYEERAKKAEERYARLLSVLLSAIQKKTN
jgi:hypothetical protein